MTESDPAGQVPAVGPADTGARPDGRDLGSQREGTGRHEHPGRQPAAERRRDTVATLIGALGVTLFSLVFIASFIGALHKPGPRGVPVGIVGTPGNAASLSAALGRAVPGGFTVTSYQSEQAARNAILHRGADAALVPGHQQVLLVASAAGAALTQDTVQAFTGVAKAAGVPLTTQNIHQLPANDPQGLSQVFFVTALLAPSLAFGELLISRFGKRMHPLRQLALIPIYAVIVAAVAVAIADPGIGALRGAPWGMFGIGTLLAFAAAVTSAAATRWGKGLGHAVILLLFIPVGIAASGTTLGPKLITPWYADLGHALLPGAALPAVQNIVYFNGDAITTQMIVLSAWAAAGAIALALTMFIRRPVATVPEPRPPADDAVAAARSAPQHGHAGS